MFKTFGTVKYTLIRLLFVNVSLTVSILQRDKWYVWGMEQIIPTVRNKSLSL